MPFLPPSGELAEGRSSSGEDRVSCWELFSHVGFIVTNLGMSTRAVDDKRGRRRNGSRKASW